MTPAALNIFALFRHVESNAVPAGTITILQLRRVSQSSIGIGARS